MDTNMPKRAVLLEVKGLQVHYGRSQALFDVDFSLREGEVVTLLGRNGMGKTTTLHAVTGIHPPSAGHIVYDSVAIDQWPSHRIARLGLSLVPEGRQVFPNLTVRENLVAAAGNRLEHPSPWTLESVLELFPSLQPRLDFMGTLLSGGEQQMLSIGRALMTNPRLLLLDDATEGLAPLVRAEIWNCLGRVKASGLSILIVDKNINDLMHFADRHYILDKGKVVWEGSSRALHEDDSLREQNLGVGM